MPKLPTGYRIASPGGLTVIICFFLPWVLQSCGNATPTLKSGWQLAAGDGTQPEYNGDPSIFFVLATGLLVLALAAFAWRRGYLLRRDAIAPLVTGLLSIVLLVLKFTSSLPEGSVRDFRYGLYGTLLGLVAILAGGILNYLRLRKADGAPRSDGSSSRRLGPLR